MAKTLIGPRLRQLRREKEQTQAQMAEALGVSPAYINLLESNQRSLSVQMLMALSETYGVDWRELLKDDGAQRLADLRTLLKDPVFGDDTPDVQQMRAAIDHAPGVVDFFLHLHTAYRTLVDRVMQAASSGSAPDQLISRSPETMLHDFFRDQNNHFPALEAAADAMRTAATLSNDTAYEALRNRLADEHGITVEIATVEEMPGTLRIFDEEGGTVRMSEALDHQNRVFQIAHVLAFLEAETAIAEIIAQTALPRDRDRQRLKVELANYFAAALLMPYDAFLEAAEAAHYDIDLLAARFGVSFEQVCHRLTTLQRDGARGIPFFFLRIDKAGNVTKRFNATSFHLAEHGGSCPRWNIHSAFRAPGVILPQFVELPEGERFLTISRTTDRPTFSRDTQDRRLAVALGCEMKYADRIGYAASYNLDDPQLLTPIGINCHLCPRQSCSQRAHQPLHIDLPIDARRRGNTRYES